MVKGSTNDQQPKGTKEIKAEARAKRLREQLRENLKRRKAQTRKRTTQDADKP